MYSNSYELLIFELIGYWLSTWFLIKRDVYTLIPWVVMVIEKCIE